MAAVSYDCLLLFAILFVGTATVLPLNHGEAIAPNNAAYSAYLLGLSFLYFGWFWTHGGQTLGCAHGRFGFDFVMGDRWAGPMPPFDSEPLCSPG